MTVALVSQPVGVREANLADDRERARVDAFVANTPGSTPFHLAGWSAAVARATGNRARYLVAERANGAVVGVLPLTEMRSRLFGRALVSTGFGVDGGILGDGVEALASGAWELAGRLGCPEVELRGGLLPKGWAVDEHSYLGFGRPFAGDEGGELAAIPRKQRGEVRRALGFDLEVSVGGDLGEHYRASAESVHSPGTPVLPARLFRGSP